MTPRFGNPAAFSLSADLVSTCPLLQGFTKEISLDRSVWAGYIKDYEGGTIMHVSRSLPTSSLTPC